MRKEEIESHLFENMIIYIENAKGFTKTFL